VARGITLAGLVAFVKGGNNVDNSAELLSVIKSLTSAMQGMLQAIQYLQNAVEIVEQRVQVLENER
jgi:hypothetical protein